MTLTRQRPPDRRKRPVPEPAAPQPEVAPAVADPSPTPALTPAATGHSLAGFTIQRQETPPPDLASEDAAHDEGSADSPDRERAESHAEGRASGRMAGAIQRQPDAGLTGSQGDTSLGGNRPGDATPLKAGGGGSTTIHPPTLTYNDYSAATLADVASLFPAEVGSVTFDFTVNTSGDPITSARLDVTQAMTMPRWLEYGRQCVPVRRAWDSFYAALRNHEDGHVTRDTQQFSGQHARFVGQAQSDTQTVSDQLRADVQAVQDAYDTSTDHGRTQTPPTILDTSVVCSPSSGGSSSGSSSGATSAADLGDYGDASGSSDGSLDAPQTMQAMRARGGDADASRSPGGEIGASVRAAVGAGGGQRLDAPTRAFMEARFGHDFGQVRVHTGAQAARSAESAGALAYTIGADIVFAADRYAPHTSAGRHLLAHELTHVTQQAAGAVAGTPLGDGLTISDPNDSDEQAAESNARRVMSDTSAMTAESAGARPTNVAPGGSSTGVQSVHSVQRWTMPALTLKSNEELLRDGGNGDLQAIKEITDFSGATDDQRFAMIRTLLNQGWVGPRDEYALEEIWRSFGDRVMAMAAAHMDLWRQSADRGAELKETIAQVKPLVTKFPQDVKDVVSSYLFLNRQVTTNEMERLGIPTAEDTPMPDPNDAQTRQIQGLQQAASAVAKLQTAQEDARQIYVGYNVISFNQTTSMVGAKFDPLHRPDYTERTTNLLMPCDYSGPITSYDQVKEKYDAATDAITAWQTLYPDIYVISREGQSATTAAFAAMTPAQARQKLGAGMRALLHDIEGVQAKLDGGDLNPLDLTPIHDQLLHNQLLGGTHATSGTNWADPVPEWVARDLVKDHQFSEALKTLALQSVAMAAFLLAPFTGGASLYVMLAGLAATGIQAYRSAENYESLAQAARTAITPGTELVTPGQVDEAKMRADTDAIALALAALAVGMAAAGEALGAIKGPPTPKPLEIPQGLTEEQFQAMSATVRSQAGEISSDIQVQGSRAAGTARPDSDIDIAIRVPEQQFDQLIDDSFGKPNQGSAKERTMLRAIETGKIQAGEAGLRPLRKTVQGQLGMDVDISIVRIGGPFDNGPMIPLK